MEEDFCSPLNNTDFFSVLTCTVEVPSDSACEEEVTLWERSAGAGGVLQATFLTPIQNGNALFGVKTSSKSRETLISVFIRT